MIKWEKPHHDDFKWAKKFSKNNRIVEGDYLMYCVNDPHEGKMYINFSYAGLNNMEWNYKAVDGIALDTSPAGQDRVKLTEFWDHDVNKDLKIRQQREKEDKCIGEVK